MTAFSRKSLAKSFTRSYLIADFSCREDFFATHPVTHRARARAFSRKSLAKSLTRSRLCADFSCREDFFATHPVAHRARARRESFDRPFSKGRAGGGRKALLAARTRRNSTAFLLPSFSLRLQVPKKSGTMDFDRVKSRRRSEGSTFRPTAERHARPCRAVNFDTVKIHPIPRSATGDCFIKLVSHFFL